MYELKKNDKIKFGLIILLITGLELFVYFSEINLTRNNTLLTTVSTIIIFIIFVFLAFKRIIVKISLTFIIICFGFSILISEFFSGLNPEKVYKTWEINKYEIILAHQENVVGPGSEPYMKLRNKYFLGLFYKDIDETDTKISSFEIGITKCIVEFKKTNTEFDLCKKIQLK